MPVLNLVLPSACTNGTCPADLLLVLRRRNATAFSAANLSLVK
jgi:hypothetical protein